MLPALLAAALTTAGAAWAAEPEAVATAPAGTSGAPPASVADQIDKYLRTSPALAPPKEGALGVTSGAEEPRKVHGVAEVAVGTNGYRSVYLRSDMPVGKTGTVSVAVGESKINGRAFGGYGGGYGYGGRFAGGERQSLGLGFNWGGDAALDPHDPRCRQAGEDGPAARYDPRFEGGRPRACSVAGAGTSAPPQ
jgi:hypothetical protein